MACERLRHELHHALQNLHAEIDRVEILTAALDAFAKPIPEYQPGFRHFDAAGRTLDQFELRDSEASEM
jgi:hypothetical protein